MELGTRHLIYIMIDSFRQLCMAHDDRPAQKNDLIVQAVCVRMLAFGMALKTSD